MKVGTGGWSEGKNQTQHGSFLPFLLCNYSVKTLTTLEYLPCTAWKSSHCHSCNSQQTLDELSSLLIKVEQVKELASGYTASSRAVIQMLLGPSPHISSGMSFPITAQVQSWNWALSHCQIASYSISQAENFYPVLVGSFFHFGGVVNPLGCCIPLTVVPRSNNRRCRKTLRVPEGRLPVPLCCNKSIPLHNQSPSSCC